MTEHIGKITRLRNDGLGHILEEGSKGDIYPFTFDKIEGYGGEYVRELGKSMGLKQGVIVRFILDQTLKVVSLHPLVFRGT